MIKIRTHTINNSKVKFIIIFSSLIIVSSFIFSNSPSDEKPRALGIILEDPNKAAPQSKVSINDTDVGNSDWETIKATYAWCTGAGTKLNPYIINGIEIDGQSSGSCITVINSEKYFIIKNCQLYASGAAFNGGIKLENVTNGQISNNNCSYNAGSGIYLTDTSNINITNNLFKKNSFGVFVYTGSNNTRISINTILNNSNHGVYIRENEKNEIVDNDIELNIGSGIELFQTNKNIIEDNSIKNNGINGINLYESNGNNITNNIIMTNDEYGIDVNTDSDNNTVINDYIYYNELGQVLIDDSNCDKNTLNKSVLVSECDKYLQDSGTDTTTSDNYNLPIEPSLVVEIKNQFFSPNITFIVVNISSSYGLDLYIASIQWWWNGTIINSNDITEIGSYLYSISLKPFNTTVQFQMYVTSSTHLDRYFQRTFSYYHYNATVGTGDIGDDDDDNEVDDDDDTNDDDDNDDDDKSSDSNGDDEAFYILFIVIFVIVAIVNAFFISVAIMLYKKRTKNIIGELKSRKKDK